MIDGQDDRRMCSYAGPLELDEHDHATCEDVVAERRERDHGAALNIDWYGRLFALRRAVERMSYGMERAMCQYALADVDVSKDKYFRQLERRNRAFMRLLDALVRHASTCCRCLAQSE